MVTKIGLDLGYADITLSDATLVVKREPSIAIIDKNTRRIVSVGNAALLPENAALGNIVRPFKNGMLYSLDFAKEMVAASLKSVTATENLRCVVGVPANFNSKQESELHSIITDGGVKTCLFVDRAVAALIGAGYSPTTSAVSVNIGASRTEIAVLYQGNIIYSESVDIGGESFDEAVQSYILTQGELNISLIDAKAIKECIGAVWEGRNAEPITITGTLALTGNRIKMSIATEDILGVFEAPLKILLNAVASAVKSIPIEYVEEIFVNGIVLTGGGAQLFGLDKMISKVFCIGVAVAKNPADCVARGLSIVNSFLPLKLRANGKNITSQLSKLYKTANNKNKKGE